MDTKQLNEEGRDLWNQKAKFWDALFGDEGNTFHRTLISPSVERLLDVKSGETVLDIGCGNGVMARRLAELGAMVTAVDFSEEFIALAQARGQKSAEPIHYQVADATDEAALVALGKFDAVVCTMAIMDMPVVTPMFRAVTQLINEGGRFVFSTMHPAFNSNNPVFLMEKGDRDGDVYLEYSIKLTTYLEVPPVKGVGAPGEPNPHYYYHRPLHELLGDAFAAGLVLDGLEEPAFPRTDADGLHWHNYWQIPPVITGRFRVA